MPTTSIRTSVQASPTGPALYTGGAPMPRKAGWRLTPEEIRALDVASPPTRPADAPDSDSDSDAGWANEGAEVTLDEDTAAAAEPAEQHPASSSCGTTTTTTTTTTERKAAAAPSSAAAADNNNNNNNNNAQQQAPHKGFLSRIQHTAHSAASKLKHAFGDDRHHDDDARAQQQQQQQHHHHGEASSRDAHDKKRQAESPPHLAWLSKSFPDTDKEQLVAVFSCAYVDGASSVHTGRLAVTDGGLYFTTALAEAEGADKQPQQQQQQQHVAEVVPYDDVASFAFGRAPRHLKVYTIDHRVYRWQDFKDLGGGCGAKPVAGAAAGEDADVLFNAYYCMDACWRNAAHVPNPAATYVASSVISS